MDFVSWNLDFRLQEVHNAGRSFVVRF